jgi:hypothetical protein
VSTFLLDLEADAVYVLERALEGGLLDDAYRYWDEARGKTMENKIEFWRIAYERTDSLGVPRAVVDAMARERGLRRRSGSARAL